MPTKKKFNRAEIHYREINRAKEIVQKSMETNKEQAL